MFSFKRNTIILCLLLFLIVISNVTPLKVLLIFCGNAMLFAFIFTGLYISVKMKKTLEIYIYFSLASISVLSKLDGKVFTSGFLLSFIFVVSYITLCIATILFAMKVCKRMKFNYKKSKSISD